MTDEVTALGAVEQATLVRRGELSARELLGVYLERIARHNPALTALIDVAGRRAVLAARGHDRARRRGADGSALAGVPVAIKDLNLVAGMRVRFGSRAFRWVVSPVDDATVKRLRAGGMIVVGKTSTSELGSAPVTEPDVHAPTRNPWHLAHTAGGSSGGAGAAVAGRLLPIAQGSDGGGSIRIPAAFGHLFGFKASRGVVVRPAHWKYEIAELAVEGPLARNVADAAAMLELLAWRREPWLATLDQPTRRGLKIAISVDSGLTVTNPEQAEAARRLARVLEGFGHVVEERAWVPLELEGFLRVWRRALAGAPVWRESLLQPVTRQLRAEGRHITQADMLATLRQLRAMAAAWYGDVDLWVSPTVPWTAPRVGATAHDDARVSFERMIPYGIFTAVFNLSGQPAMSIPMGLSAAGMPLAAQIAGRHGTEAELLRLARQLEQALGGFERRPNGY